MLSKQRPVASNYVKAKVSITYQGIEFDRGVFMVYAPLACERGISAICSWCGEIECKCGRTTFVCPCCLRLLEVCTCEYGSQTA